MPDAYIGSWIRHFLRDHLIGECNFSKNTQASYRDTLVLLLPFVSKSRNKSIEKTSIDDISADTLRLFLQHLEKDRKCSVSTRNQRLAAIHSLARFIAQRSPEHIAWATEICSVPFKKTTKPVVGYLEKSEMDAILDTPDCSTVQGKRDYALLLFLYNTGSRASEAAELTIGDLNIGEFLSVKILGKGNKIRYCPLWSLTVKVIKPLIAGREPNQPVFLNCRKQSMTRFGIHSLVKRTASKAKQKVPSLCNKVVSAHMIRHTSAVHLLRAGVDINTIRAWLGHVSLDTTNIYAEIDLEMKSKALSHCEIMETTQKTEHWNEQKDLMAFLKGL